MLTRDEAEARFVEELPRLRRTIAAHCRRHGVQGDDADDFASWVQLRVVEDDYTMLQKFRGESTLSTFLTVVVRMLYRDWVVQQRGRWRASAEAQRQGALAVRLEQLVHRDGMPLAQAAERLRTDRVTDLSDGALARILRSLPAREPLRPHVVDAEAIEVMPGASSAEERVVQEDARRRRTSADRALDGALAQLSADDRLLVRLRFWDGLSVADIARALAIPQKPLYRRLERLLGQLRARLTECGFTGTEVQELLDDADVREPDAAGDAEKPASRPSNTKRSA